MDLPIDHFRLLGVSPSAEPDAILRRLQSRIDTPPDQGFTHESLVQRAVLLRRSADLLTDASDRAEYEAALLRLSESHPNGTVGLDLPASSEVAGLMLLWESHGSVEAFQLARQGLQPPQAPALGSGREADLTLLAALACRDAALEEQEQRRYESAAQLLIDGIELQKRMGKLPDQQRELEEDLEALLPFRILDLLSRDLSDQESHQLGLTLLDQLVVARGGLESADDLEQSAPLTQADFESFFQQIRRFLTVQEQIDLFSSWSETGASDAGFLAVLALTASGFSRRKPECLEQARERLQQLPMAELDPMPILGCLDLLLGNVQAAERHFAAIRDAELQAWFLHHPGDQLASQCEYCRAWLERDVLPGYRDVDASVADLDAWFADRDVQSYVDRLDRQSQRSSSDGSDPLPWSIPTLNDPFPSLFEDQDSEAPANEDNETPRFAWNQRWLIRTSAVTAVAALLVVGVLLLRRTRDASPAMPTPMAQESAPEEQRSPEQDQSVVSPTASLNPGPVAAEKVTPLLSDEPSEAELQTLLQAWLDAKASALVGQPFDLTTVARDGLVGRVEQEKARNTAAGNTRTVEASITSLQVVDRKPWRIEVKAQVAYRDRLSAADGSLLEETTPRDLSITYVLGRDGKQWRLQDYISAS